MPCIRRLFAFPLLMIGWCAAVAATETSVSPASPTLLTNLLQLRHYAEQRPLVVTPFRIVADVLDVDPAGMLALRDLSRTEFIRLDLRGRTIEPGARICLEGKGCSVLPRSFGLVIVPGMVVDDDGIHAMTVESGQLFLHAGRNPITVEWFNRLDKFGLSVECEGPGLPRQPISSSILSREQVEAATGMTNSFRGLDYKCYEGSWGFLPDFAKLQPVKTGVVTNFNLDVRTRDENVGLEFSGFIAIPNDGFYTFHLTSDDGSRLLAGDPFLDIGVISHGFVPPVMGKIPATVQEKDGRPWVTLEGIVVFAGVRGAGGELVMRAGKDDIRVAIFDGGNSTPDFPPGTKVRVSGVYQDLVAEDGSPNPGMLWVSSWHAVRPVPASENMPMASDNQKAASVIAAEANALPAVATVAEVKAIPREWVKRQLPVSVRGVVTAVLPSYLACAVVQDSTKGISIFLRELKETATLKYGECYQVDGVIGPGPFAPVIIARRITDLGAGHLPQPLHATWDQMMNGSLDTQYAEIEGVVTAVHDQQIMMLTEGGEVTLQLGDFPSEELAGLKDAVVRIRGCIFANFNLQTHQLEAGSAMVMGGALAVLQAAPRDPFCAAQKSINELLLYDPKAAPFRRLKVGGQVVHGRAGEYFLTDGTNGLRVTTRDSGGFAVGELVEAAGFIELGGPVAELKEAVMRHTGRTVLPAPSKLAPDNLLLARYSGTLVQMEATLMNQWREGSEYVLELQSGFLAFKARMDGQGEWALPPAGSRLELTGVYVPQGNRAADGTVSGFELRLPAATDLRVLATPPWWNLKRVLVLAGILAGLLFAVLAWNKELQLKVRERGRQLEVEINHRQRAELQRAAEAERARIARDLHDELGTGLTEVSLLAGTGLGKSEEPGKKDDRLRVIAEKARALVSGLDVIVWAIDPKRNSLQSFADYLGRYVTELFSSSDMVCRFKIPIECEAVTLPETARHSLFLAVKEALNNVIRHARASEVELQISQSGDRLRIVIADNGRGFDGHSIRRGNGLTNLHERLEALNGQCHIESEAGKGTTVKFIVPLPCNPS